MVSNYFEIVIINFQLIAIGELQKFVNIQANAIHETDKKALVTVGSWSEKAGTDMFGYTNYWKDDCLISAGEQTNGILDFYEWHSYGYNNQYSTYSPFQNINVISYNLTKPLIIGEFASKSCTLLNINQMYLMLYNNGYNGAWDWDAIGGTGVCNTLFVHKI